MGHTKKMILVAGDSWGVGEWSDPTKVLHGGLAQYFNEAGIPTVNLSHGGISNLDIVNRISLYMDRNQNLKVDKIYVFQTEYDRDHKHWYLHDDNDWEDIEHCWIERFYHHLSNIAIKYNTKIYLIGGAGDTIWFDDMPTDYPGCYIACQSMTNLLCYHYPRATEPVHSWYSSRSVEFLKELKHRNPKNLEKVLNKIDLGYQREALVRENPRFFYPDGVHPNRHGHLALYNYLVDQ